MSDKPGLYWHVHHDVLYEYCYDPKGRIDYIKAGKPKHEINTRLRLMRPIEGKLGNAEAGAAYVKAWDAYVNAWDACGKAADAYDKARAAWKATIKPGEAEALHAKECPNCPWNGTTIFPKDKP